MDNKNLEERLNKLEEANQTLQHELERTQAVNEIQKVIHTLQWLHTSNKTREVQKLFAKKSPDVRIYFGNLGFWEGPDEIFKPGKSFREYNPGYIALHFMANPIIEVAGDGQTAKGVWIASGMYAKNDERTGEPTAEMEYNRYGIDFIKEDGQWKILHHHVFDLFGLGWDEKWADQFKEARGGMPIPEEMKPSHPPTPLDEPFKTDAELPYIPYPEPYETFDPNNIY